MLVTSCWLAGSSHFFAPEGRRRIAMGISPWTGSKPRKSRIGKDFRAFRIFRGLRSWLETATPPGPEKRTTPQTRIGLLGV